MRIAALALIAAIAATPVLAQAQERRPMMLEGTMLTVNAEGRASAKPDLATINTGVVTDARTAEAALSANAQKMTSVIAAIRAAGVAERDVQTSSINLNPQYAYEEGRSPRVTGYQAQASLSVRVRDLTRVGRVIDAVVAQGSNQVNGVMFGLDNPDAALDNARTEAVKKARARAEIYANAAGMRVQRIIAISEGGGFTPPVPMPMAMEARAGGAPTPVAPGELDLTANVSVTFELK